MLIAWPQHDDIFLVTHRKEKIIPVTICDQFMSCHLCGSGENFVLMVGVDVLGAWELCCTVSMEILPTLEKWWDIYTWTQETPPCRIKQLYQKKATVCIWRPSCLPRRKNTVTPVEQPATPRGMVIKSTEIHQGRKNENPLQELKEAWVAWGRTVWQ